MGGGDVELPVSPAPLEGAGVDEVTETEEVSGLVAGTPTIGPEELDPVEGLSASRLANGAYPQLLQVQPWANFTICPFLHCGQVTVRPLVPDKAAVVAPSPVKT